MGVVGEGSFGGQDPSRECHFTWCRVCGGPAFSLTSVCFDVVIVLVEVLGIIDRMVFRLEGHEVNLVERIQYLFFNKTNGKVSEYAMATATLYLFIYF